VWDLRANRLRPAGWTSADAAGLPILAGLVRYEEVARGRIDHAIRVTVDRSQASYLWPARHQAGQGGPSLPPMGLRLRLKAGVDIGRFPGQARVILQAMRTYGLVVADNGSSGFIGGVPDERWDNDALHQLGRVTLADFEVVDTAPLRVSVASAAFRGAPRTTPARPATTRRARPAPALLPGVGRRWFMPEPRFATASAEATPAASPALDPGQAAARTGDSNGSGSPALLPQILAAILGVVAAALAFRQVTLRTRRLQPPGGRHAPGGRRARTGTAPDADQATPAPPDPHNAPPDPDPAGSRRP
jgi:hypothetical protein